MGNPHQHTYPTTQARRASPPVAMGNAHRHTAGTASPSLSGFNFIASPGLDGLRALAWLCQQQTDEHGYFAPIGSDGFYVRDGERALFDQQPIEVHATVSACLEAYLATRNRQWLDETLRAYRWFLGANKLGKPVYDAQTCGCCDGLQIDRLNQNQGAESTLAFLLSTAELPGGSPQRLSATSRAGPNAVPTELPA